MYRYDFVCTGTFPSSIPFDLCMKLIAGSLAAFLVTGLIAASIILCSATLHVTRRTGALDSGTDWSNVSVRAADGAKLVAWFAEPPKKSTNCVMILHGIGDSKLGSAGFASPFLEAGYAVLLSDSRAHGASGGELVTYGLREKEDVLEWIRFLRGSGCRRLFGLGESLGAAVLIQTAAITSDFSAIIAESSFSSLPLIAQYRVEAWIGLPHWVGQHVSMVLVRSAALYARMRYGVDLALASPLVALTKARTPILFIHGLDDTATPPWHSQVLAAANPTAVLWLVPGAGHCGAFATSPKEFREHVLSWFGRFQR